jgi:hypothetical protein
MDTPTPPSASPEYSGLKEELQKIAGIIEQYPDNLKQRAFELLITAYLNSNHAKDGAGAVAPAAPAEESAPVEAPVAEGVEDAAPLPPEEPAVESAPVEVESTEPVEPVGVANFSARQDPPVAAQQAPDARIKAGADNSSNMLRNKIRLRTMTQVPFRTQN